jgi:6-phosphogluconolactonase
MNIKLRLSTWALFSLIVITACGGGDISPVVDTGSYTVFITVAPSGKFAYAANWGSNNISVYTIDSTTGTLTAGAAVAAGANPVSVSVDPLGKFIYAANETDSTISVYKINTATGALQ